MLNLAYLDLWLISYSFLIASPQVDFTIGMSLSYHFNNSGSNLSLCKGKLARASPHSCLVTGELFSSLRLSIRKSRATSYYIWPKV